MDVSVPLLSFYVPTTSVSVDFVSSAHVGNASATPTITAN